MSRAEIKHELGVEQTMLRARDNNALKFSITPRGRGRGAAAAGAARLQCRRCRRRGGVRGYPLPRDGGDGRRADRAAGDLLKRFDPAALEARLQPRHARQHHARRPQGADLGAVLRDLQGHRARGAGGFPFGVRPRIRRAPTTSRCASCSAASTPAAHLLARQSAPSDARPDPKGCGVMSRLAARRCARRRRRLGRLRRPPPPPPPTMVNLTLTATADVNPTAASRARRWRCGFTSSASTANFNSAEFFPLYKADGDAEDRLVKREEYVLAPGQTQDGDDHAGRDRSSRSALFAAFRDFQHATWRGAAEIQPNKTTNLTVTAGRDGVARSARQARFVTAMTTGQLPAMTRRPLRATRAPRVTARWAGRTRSSGPRGCSCSRSTCSSRSAISSGWSAPAPPALRRSPGG